MEIVMFGRFTVLEAGFADVANVAGKDRGYSSLRLLLICGLDFSLD